MKFKALIPVIILLSSSYCFAQEFYVRLNSGYGVGISNQTDFDYYSTETAPNVYNTSYKSKDYSYGKGTYFSAALGCFMNQNMGFEVEVQYLHGASYSLHREYSYINTGKFYYDFENYAQAYMLNPSFILKTQLSVLKPYLKLGPVISFGSIKNGYSGYNISTTNTKTTIKSEIEYSGNIFIGLNTAVGVSYELFRNIDLSIELNSKNLSYAPKEGEIKKYLINGVDYLQQLSTASKKVIFAENVESTSSQSVNSPSQERKQYYPFSSLSLLLGISIGL